MISRCSTQKYLLPCQTCNTIRLRFLSSFIRFASSTFWVKVPQNLPNYCNLLTETSNLTLTTPKTLRLSNCPIDILIIPCGMRIRSTHLLISFRVLNHAAHKTIDFQIDLNILRTTRPTANLTLPVDCACSSMYYSYKRTKTAQKINPVTIKTTKL